ncbi:hypothetical protein FOB58_000799 [Candida parapsilosis]|uniref:DUF2470 domain-containing protein n=2 Tax=Candida parapsilosis TaxID=5480 RepID=G8BGJ1_CANPC|nr:uncharacterized protein CPAR2_206170 [Candida parapsilosis]KAF6054877.1 hypothetical protein FOB58_000799 [Candida parapsilosis]KAF6056099.1 hypothetical protein FOB59_000611 [Candida parapsilosis]KAF6059031.1 hypothetical protein FOB60_000613 [Candida parapsilosis]KAF6067788.1 hypothetical protein FOB61_000613 [Candida parapsilosis]KAI5905380.1 hypothetical protein K4G60_g4639 [Candida parapsilosis]
MSDPSARIKSHMNKDHQLALRDYVVVYGSVDPKYLVEDSVGIKEVDTEKIVIEYDVINPSSTKSLKLKWNDAKENEQISVKSLSDIKSKLIAMAKYSAGKQGFAEKKLTKIFGPDAQGIPMYPIWAILLLNAYNPTILRSVAINSAWIKKAIEYLPSVAFAIYNWSELHALKLCIGLFVAHLGEILFISGPFLKKYRAPFGVRLVYYIMNLIEGFPVLLRLKKHA